MSEEEIKENVEKEKKMVYLPPVFMEGETLNKFSLVENYLNCPRYVSRSGATQEGCFVLKVNENEITFKEVRGIFLNLNKVLTIDSSRKIFWSADEVFNIAKQINYRDNKEILIKWSNYGFEAFNKFKKGRMLKFEKVGEQGNLKIFKVPFPWEGFNYDGELKKEKWEETKEVSIYNHKLIFEQPVKAYKNLVTIPGDGILIAIDREIFVRAESPDHGNNVFSLSPGLGMGFYLFSHPKPRRSVD